MKLAKEREDNGLTIKDISEITKVSRSAIYRELKNHQGIS